jgi:hypothetical protein
LDWKLREPEKVTANVKLFFVAGATGASNKTGRLLSDLRGRENVL